MVAPSLMPALVTGFIYFFELCDNDKKNVLMLQVGVLDKSRESQRELNRIAQIADTSNLDGLNFVLKEVVKALLQRCDSCRFAYLSVTECVPDFLTKIDDISDEYDDSVDSGYPFPLYSYYFFRFVVKLLVAGIHTKLKSTKEKNYDDKNSNQLFKEVLTRELARYDRDEETFANVDGRKYEKEGVGKAHSMVGNDYLVVTILVLASGIYSISPLECSIEHVKTVLQNFNTIPKSKIKSVEVLWTPQKEDEAVSEQELKRVFPLLKPVNLSGLEELAFGS